MAIPLLKTKVQIPSERPTSVQRSRLLSRLNEGLHRRLILLSAPAGFGKTVLLHQWTAQCGLSVAWLSLDENDSDPTRFWTYFIAALQTLKSDLGKSILVCLQSPHPPPIENILSGLINEISENLNQFVMVLDDYHLINSQLVHASLTYLLDHLPEQMHLVISGRVDPPFPLARLRARNQLLELRATDLRFTPEETAVFLNDIMKLDILAGDVAVLAARTEGWIASLQMAGVSLQNRPDKSQFIAGFSGSHRYILDYLTNEVLSGQDTETQTFLLQTSVLHRLSGPLCNAVTGKDNGQKMLERLEAANLFVQPLDEERRWYRYHQLFADLLHSQLSMNHPEQIPILHNRASLWLEKVGLVEEAIDHAISAQDMEKTAGLIESIAETWISQSQIATLLKNIASLRQDTISRRPWLSICYAWALFLSGQADRVVPLLMSMDNRLTSTEDLSDELRLRVRGHSLTIQGYLTSFQGNIPEAVRLTQEAAALLPPNDLMARSANALNRGLATFMSGEVTEATQYLKEAGEVAQEGHNLYVVVESICSLGDVQAEGGRLHAAAQTYRQAVQMGLQYGCGGPLPASGHAYHGLAQLHYEWNNLEEALRNIKISIELSESARLPAASDYITLSRIKAAMGDAEGAAQATQKAREAAVGRMLDAIQVSSREAHLLLTQNDLTALERWVTAQEPALSISRVPDYRFEMPYLTLVKVSIALNKMDRLTDQLEKLVQKAESQGRVRSVIVIRAIRALALFKLDDIKKAQAELDQALSLAKSEGYIRTFVDHGPLMQQLLRQTLKTIRLKDYIHGLLTAFPSAGPQTDVARTETGFVEQYSGREKQILLLMAEGKSNAQIAANLFISLNTVKWYIRHLFSKLGAENRVEAIQQAKKLNLI